MNRLPAATDIPFMQVSGGFHLWRTRHDYGLWTTRIDPDQSRDDFFQLSRLQARNLARKLIATIGAGALNQKEGSFTILNAPRTELMSLKEELLLELHVDGLDPCHIYQFAKPYNSGGSESLRQQCIGVVAELLSEGIVEASDLMSSAWDVTPGEAIVRIANDWLAQAPDGQPEIGAIVWLTVTDFGRTFTADAAAKLRTLRESDPDF